MSKAKLYLLVILCFLCLMFVPGLPETCANIIVDGVGYLNTKIQVNIK